MTANLVQLSWVQKNAFTLTPSLRSLKEAGASPTSASRAER
jgi:hypothetical protein